jgi:hypothetical protein
VSPTLGSRRRRNLRRAVVGSAVAVLALSGCGVGEDALGPGLAAQVGDTSIELDQVDDAAADLCDMITVLSKEGTSPAVPGAVIRDNSLQYVVLRELGDQLAEEYDVQAGDAYRSSLDTNKEQLAGFGVDSDLLGKVVPTLSSGDYFLDIVQQIGREDLDLTSEEDGQQQGITRGLEIARQWEADHGLEVNPRFSSMSIGDMSEIVVSEVRELSVPVSDFAKQAVAGAAPADPASPDTSYVDSLPESQRCG